MITIHFFLAGKGLFCSKKPPKTDNGDNILTHHQRKHVELAKFHLFSSSEMCKFGLDISFDDKAYIRPETSGLLYLIEILLNTVFYFIKQIFIL